MVGKPPCIPGAPVVVAAASVGPSVNRAVVSACPSVGLTVAVVTSDGPVVASIGLVLTSVGVAVGPSVETAVAGPINASAIMLS